jgi:sulfoxide reductase heme-binding subunit YedZ
VRIASRRAARRLARHHLPIALCAVVVGGVILLVTWDARRPFQAWSMATAYVALLLLAVTLLIGPLDVLRRGRHPLSTDFRRDAGIWAGAVSLLHFAVGWQVHMKQRYLYWFRERVPGGSLVPRFDLFGFANYSGLLAVVLVALLVALSSDRALRRLGALRWKRWQRANYPLMALVAVHGAAYQLSERRHLPWILGASLIVTSVAVAQWAGAQAFRARHVVARVD